MGTPTPDTASSLLREALEALDAGALRLRIRAYLAAPAQRSDDGCGATSKPDGDGYICTLAPGHAGDHDGSGLYRWPNATAPAPGWESVAAEQQQAAARAEEEVTRWRAAGREALAVLDSNFVNIEVDTRATADRLTRALDALRLLLTPEAAPPSATPTDADHGGKNDR